MPVRSSARGSISSGRRLYMSPWESFTITEVAPPWNAPSTAALASRVISFREVGKSSLPRHTCWRVAIPAMPSMSTETKTFVIGRHESTSAHRGTKASSGRDEETAAYFAAGACWTVAAVDGTGILTDAPLLRCAARALTGHPAYTRAGGRYRTTVIGNRFFRCFGVPIE